MKRLIALFTLLISLLLLCNCEKTAEPLVISVSDITLNCSSATMVEGESQQLIATISPKDATNKTVLWETSNLNTATVSSDGLVTAVSTGHVTITAKSDDGGILAKCNITVDPKIIHVRGVSFDKTEYECDFPDSFSLTATVNPEDATNRNLLWFSSNDSVATVDSEGNIATHKPGSCIINAKSEDGGMVAKCVLTVNSIISSIKLNTNSLSLKVGQSGVLEEIIDPSNATDKSIKWSSDNTSVATVSVNGVVTAMGSGTAIITARNEKSGLSASCAVCVVEPLRGISLNCSSLSLIQYDCYQLSAIFSPSNATNQNVKWTSENPAVVSVSYSGFVTAVSAGNTIISVSSEDGGYQDYCYISVTADSHKAVDLGLSVKWSMYNYDASSPTEVGGYYLWGDPIGNAVIMEYNAPSQTSICGTSYDIVHKNWGGNWRLPTKNEVKELNTKCKWEKSTKNGVSGFNVTGPNGNSIFMPATGYAYPASGPIGTTKVTDPSSLLIMTGESYFDSYGHFAYMFQLTSNLSYGFPSWNADLAKFPVRGVR